MNIAFVVYPKSEVGPEWRGKLYPIPSQILIARSPRQYKDCLVTIGQWPLSHIIMKRDQETGMVVNDTVEGIMFELKHLK